MLSSRKSSEQRVGAADLPVDPPDGIRFFHVLSPAKLRGAAFIDRFGRTQTVLHHFHGNRVEPPGIDRIVDEGTPKRDRAAALALGRGVHRPITLEHPRSRNEDGIAQGVRALNRLLKAEEEEQLVPNDGATDHATKLVALQWVCL